MHGGLNTLGTIIVRRRGRNRKPGPRDTNGNLVRGPKVDYRAMAALQPHRRDVPEADRLSEKAGTSLGYLNLTRTISNEQHEAGRLYAVDCGAYFASIGVPTGLGGGGRGYACSAEINCENCECRRRKSNYDEAYIALMDAGQKCAKAVAHVAVHDKKLVHGELSPLIRGLDALVKHYGLTAGRKPSNPRNTN